MTTTEAPTTVGADVCAPPFVRTDGGRADAGYRGTTGDCVTRALAVVTGLPYQEVYDLVNATGKTERMTRKRRKHGRSSARTGVYKPTTKRLAEALGGVWTPTMFIGSGTTVHVRAGELPEQGRHMLNLSKHCAAWIDGVLYDSHDCSRGGTRAVYGYWTFPE